MNESPETNETNIVAISNQKGGASKTTNTVHLAGALNERGHTVLVVDLDKQGGLTNAFGHTSDYYDLERETTMYEVLYHIDRNEEINTLIQKCGEFDLIPATERYMNRANISQLSEAGRSHERLSLALDELETDYDWVLIDTPPDLNVLTDNAIVAGRNVLIPFFPEKLNQNSFRILLKQIEGLESLYGPVNDLALIASRVEQNNEHTGVVETVRESFEQPLFVVPKRTDLSGSIGDECTIFDYKPDSDRAEEARDVYREIADLVESEVQHV